MHSKVLKCTRKILMSTFQSTQYSSTFAKNAKVLVLVLEYFQNTQYSSTFKVLGPNSGASFGKISFTHN